MRLTKKQLAKVREIEYQFKEYGYNFMSDLFLLDENYPVLPLKGWIRSFVSDKDFREKLSSTLGVEKDEMTFEDLWNSLIEVRVARKDDIDENSQFLVLYSDNAYVGVERNTVPVSYIDINLNILPV
jgi:hypothetical protein